jgi:succinate dehydrogenase / fumarate reductase, cytochrome b subunit
MATTMDRPGGAPIRPRSNRPRPWPVQFYRSAVGKKWVMAVTGIALMGYVFVHAVGNLKLYVGAEDINHYGEWLRQLLVPFLPSHGLLWILRVGLLAAFVLHIHAAYALTRMNQGSRAGGYEQSRDWQAASFASRTMRWTGTIILLFVLFHLADFTWGTANPDFVHGDVYRNVVASFERVPVAILYLVANVALVIHLFHGAWSLFQSLGLNNPRWNSWRRGFAIGFASLVGVMNLSFPLAVLTGVVSADDNPDCRVVGNTIETCELYEEDHDG